MRQPPPDILSELMVRVTVPVVLLLNIPSAPAQVGSSVASTKASCTPRPSIMCRNHAILLRPTLSENAGGTREEKLDRWTAAASLVYSRGRARGSLHPSMYRAYLDQHTIPLVPQHRRQGRENTIHEGKTGPPHGSPHARPASMDREAHRRRNSLPSTHLLYRRSLGKRATYQWALASASTLYRAYTINHQPGIISLMHKFGGSVSLHAVLQSSPPRPVTLRVPALSQNGLTVRSCPGHLNLNSNRTKSGEPLVLR